MFSLFYRFLNIELNYILMETDSNSVQPPLIARWLHKLETSLNRLGLIGFTFRQISM